MSARRRTKRQPDAVPGGMAIYDQGKVGRRDAALLAARAQGCTCEPDIRLDESSARIAHDDWCALLRRLDCN